MRALTFKGYLLSQLQQLSGFDSTSLYAFSRMAFNNARLKDVLSLYLVLYTEDNLRDKLLKKYDFMNSSCNRLSGINEYNLDSYLNPDNSSAYKTVFENYLHQCNKKNNEDKLKLMMYEKISVVKENKKISNYKIYKTLNLNHGNINSFLKYGDTNKVSLDTVRRILAFVNEY